MPDSNTIGGEPLPPHLTLTVTTVAAPFQMEGLLGDIRWYYRARHGKWRIELDDQVVAGGTVSESYDLADAIGHVLRTFADELMIMFNADEDVRWDWLL